MRYSDLLELILIKLNISAEEAEYDGVLSKIEPLCNEALGDIANHGKPFYNTNVVNVFPTGTDVSGLNIGASEFVVTNGVFTFPPNFIALTNEFIAREQVEIREVAGVKEIFVVGELTRIDGRFFKRLNNRQLTLPREQLSYRYYFPTKARYERITKNGDPIIDIEQSILDLIPNYVVSELLRHDDLATSSHYRQYYELGIAALDDTVLSPAGTMYNEDW